MQNLIILDYFIHEDLSIELFLSENKNAVFTQEKVHEIFEALCQKEEQIVPLDEEIESDKELCEESIQSDPSGE